MLLHFLISQILVFGFFSSVESYASGAPELACSQMTPNHGVTPQGPEGPYEVEAVVSENQGKVTVTVSGNATVNSFKGMFLQARRQVGEGAIGSWELPSNGNFKNVICNLQTTSALTHSNPSNKNLPLSFTWTAPSVNISTNYTIYVTVVREYRVFYVMIPSNRIVVNPKKNAAPTLKSGSFLTLFFWVFIYNQYFH